MKKDVIDLRKKTSVSAKNFKRGDLCLTAQIHRVVGPFKEGRYGEFRVVTVWPPCEVCFPDECTHEHIMRAGPGQQGIMKVEGLT